ncbi:MAG: class I SAM-dependent methyltransferase [Ruminococcus sp.]|nr:class I SAM-dependent methyltransferase [Ruminococcus sp.]
MGGYGDLARFYDRLTENVGYGEIAELIDLLVRKYGSEHEVIVDLACGTGTLSVELVKFGYDVIGVDSSEDMLAAAFDKAEGAEGVSFLCQDMTELSLWGAADAVICVLDSLNHLDNEHQLERTFSAVSDHVCDGGLFIFDLNTEYKHREILADNAFCYDLDGLFCSWQNETAEDGTVTEYLNFFEEQEEGTYQRYSEEIAERIYSDALIMRLLTAYGFELIGRFDGFSEEPVRDNSQRILYVCKRLDR